MLFPVLTIIYYSIGNHGILYCSLRQKRSNLDLTPDIYLVPTIEYIAIHSVLTETVSLT